MKAWSPEEDDLIQRSHAKLGPKWRDIVKLMPAENGRTYSSVRNRFQRIERGKKLRAAGQKKNKCRRCGEFIYGGHICEMKKQDCGPAVNLGHITRAVAPPTAPTGAIPTLVGRTSGTLVAFDDVSDAFELQGVAEARAEDGYECAWPEIEAIITSSTAAAAAPGPPALQVQHMFDPLVGIDLHDLVAGLASPTAPPELARQASGQDIDTNTYLCI